RRGRYVLYWCRWSRRVEANHELAFAAGVANRMKLPLVVYQRITAAGDRSHTFELQGVPEFAAAVRCLDAGFVLQLARRKHSTAEDRSAIFDGAALVVTDDCLRATPPLAVQLIAVDSTCIVPMEAIGGPCYAAYSIRPRIQKLLPQHLKPVAVTPLRVSCTECFPRLHTGIDPGCIDALVAECAIDHSVPPSTVFRGGRAAALRTLDVFLKDRLHRYASEKNEPSAHATSDLSPYLHYGHIGALEVALAVREHAEAHRLMDGEFLEELIVRRELAYNFAHYTPRLDTLDALPAWARKTIADHRRATRETIYSGSSSSLPPRTTICETLRKRNFACEARSTAITACIGARRFCSGRRQRRTLSQRCFTYTIDMLWMATIPILTRISFGVSDCMTGHSPKSPFLGRFDPWYGPGWNGRPT
ncbi:MAG TPA: hypothetical protein VNV86_03220, partial [Candidatus Acidoferrum sp.]|nr:hypothetical protein [Candidatus Acidoferrum sp.]